MTKILSFAIDKLKLLKEYVDIQASRDELWFISTIVTENILQEELRRMVWMIEEGTIEEIKSIIYDEKKRYKE